MIVWPDNRDAPRCAEAAEWVVRLSGESVCEADALAFDAWIEADPQNAHAYDAAAALWREYGRNASAVAAGLAEARRRPATRQRIYLIAAGVAAAAVATFLLAPGAFSPPARTAIYATAAGQQHTVRLEDGSVVDMDAGTRIEVSFRRGERDVTLRNGEALFDVVHDPRRPFLIATGDRTVRVVGTQFDVRRREGRVSVAVTRGVVEVLPARGASGGAFRLHAGQRLDHAEGATDARIGRIAPEEALGWRSGRRVYRDRPLSEVAADLSSAFGTPVRVDDARLAAAPVSAVLILDDRDAVVRRLALLVSASTVRSGGVIVLQPTDAGR